MIKKIDLSKYLWIVLIPYMSFLLIGSFVVSGNFLDLFYVIVLYSYIILEKVSKK